MIGRSRCVAAALILLSCSAGAQAQELALHDGDRVVFYGDSITAQRLYTRFVEDIVLTRYPQLHVSFWNAGVPGDTVYGGYTGDTPTRIKRDVLPPHPTVITVMLGMNDGYYMAFSPKYFAVFKDGYGKLLDALKTAVSGARITLISPTPYDEVTHGTEFAHYNEVVSHHSDFVKELATQSHLAFSDFNRDTTNLLHAGADTRSPLASLLVPDRIHPAEAAHWVMAAELARTWGFSPLVSSVRIDAVVGKATAVENTQIANFKMIDSKMQWTQTDNALPLPLTLGDAMMQFVLSISNLAASDKQILQVDGLSAPHYVLRIDQKVIGTFSREELGSGVNLALYATPMEDQAKGVDAIELKRTRLDETHFIVAIEDPKVANEEDARHVLESKDAALIAEQRKLAQPKPHRFELSPR